MKALNFKHNIDTYLEDNSYEDLFGRVKQIDEVIDFEGEFTISIDDIGTEYLEDIDMKEGVSIFLGEIEKVKHLPDEVRNKAVEIGLHLEDKVIITEHEIINTLVSIKFYIEQ